MLLQHLSLTNVRNFVRLETAVPTGPTLIVGGNAQGKTSLLEAVYYLARATSPHAQSDRQLINFLALQEATPFARLVAEYRRADRPQRVEIRLVLEPGAPGSEPRLHREVLLNGVKRRISELAAGLHAVLFLPQDLRVLEGPPSERRQHLDSSLAQADGVYAEALSEYSKVLAQRNALLKQLDEQGKNGSQMTFWDEELAEQGATLIRARALALAEHDRIAAPIHSELTRGRETLHLEYLPSYDPLPPAAGQLGLPIQAAPDRTVVSRQSIRDGLLQALERTRSEDIGRRATSLGPHRDDFRFTANGIDLRAYGSRGQNRTAMLALKLAEIEWLHQRTSEWPILLLDEVLAELDGERRQDLLRRVTALPQALVTAADIEMFGPEFRRTATTWEMTAGTLRPRPPDSVFSPSGLRAGS
ncbi:MAG: DNA replication and repair protein RecF, partial [Anaerolineales bacterium]|nr:DNA replication and repair protein RecF [Anaerolineales bacterium]